MKERHLNSALNGHWSAALSPLDMTPELCLIVHVVHRKDLTDHSMTPVLHWDTCRRKVRSQNINPEMQN